MATGFKQATASSMVIVGSLLREKAPCITTSLAIKDFRASGGWVHGFKSDILLCTKLYSGNSQSLDPSTVEVRRKEQLLEIIASYEPQNICNADESGLYCMLPHNLQWWQEFQGEDDSSVSLQCQWD